MTRYYRYNDGYLNECRHEYILSFLLNVIDALADAAERWHDLVSDLHAKLKKKTVAYEAR